MGATQHGLDGRLAWVTGGGTGIGKATATWLARAGATVAISGRRAEELEKTALSHPEILRYTNGLTVRKIIVVPGAEIASIAYVIAVRIQLARITYCRTVVTDVAGWDW